MEAPRWSLSRAWTVAGIYFILAIVMTWPLVTTMDRTVAGDMGDPLFNCWVMAWTGGQLLLFLRGDFGAISQYWNGNAFYPARLTIAYSEHLTPQMLQMLPLFALTGNIVFCYNVAIFLTFVLSGLGMYLLIREFTGNTAAAFVAGLAFAFAPYRLDQYAHLEVLSSEWMPFVFFGFRRFFVSGRLRPLVGGAAALLAQALSCGYYMAYFTPFAVAYCLYEIVSRRKWRDLRMWSALIGAGACVLAVTGAFLAVYFRVRHLGDVGVRDINEILYFSADTHSFGTIASTSKLWGHLLQWRPAAEGQGFQGFTIMLLAFVGISAAVVRAVTRAKQSTPLFARWRKHLAACVAVIVVALVMVLGALLVNGRFFLELGGEHQILANGSGRLFREIAIGVVALVLISPFFRRVFRGVPGSSVAFWAWCAVAAAAMSLGPMIHVNGHIVGRGLYAFFYDWVPGFDGLRVPSLNFMIVALFLSVLVGFGAATLLGRQRRAGAVFVTIAAVAILAEHWSVPTGNNLILPTDGYAPMSATLPFGRQLSPVYAKVRDMPAGTVLIEFPFGLGAHEIRYEFYAGIHRKPIVNGYSGFFPAPYQFMAPILGAVPDNPEAAWNTLKASGATHAIVHEGWYLGDRGRDVSQWLRDHGARDVIAAGSDRLLQLKNE